MKKIFKKPREFMCRECSIFLCVLIAASIACALVSILLIFFIIQKETYVIVGGSKSALQNLGLIDTDLPVIKVRNDDKREYVVIRLRKNGAFVIVSREEGGRNKLAIELPFGLSTRISKEAGLGDLHFDPSSMLTKRLEREIKKDSEKTHLQNLFPDFYFYAEDYEGSYTLLSKTFHANDTEVAIQLATQIFNQSLIDNMFSHYGENFVAQLEKCEMASPAFMAFSDAEDKDYLRHCRADGYKNFLKVRFDDDLSKRLDNYFAEVHKNSIRNAPKVLHVLSSLQLMTIIEMAARWASEFPLENDWDPLDYPLYYQKPNEIAASSCQVIAPRTKSKEKTESFLLTFSPQIVMTSQQAVLQYLLFLSDTAGAPGITQYLNKMGLKYRYSTNLQSSSALSKGEKTKIQVELPESEYKISSVVRMFNQVLSLYFTTISKMGAVLMPLYTDFGSKSKQHVDLIKYFESHNSKNTSYFINIVGDEFFLRAIAQNFLYTRDVENVLVGFSSFQNLSVKEFQAGTLGLVNPKRCSIYYTESVDDKNKKPLPEDEFNISKLEAKANQVLTELIGFYSEKIKTEEHDKKRKDDKDKDKDKDKANHSSISISWTLNESEIRATSFGETLVSKFQTWATNILHSKYQPLKYEIKTSFYNDNGVLITVNGNTDEALEEVYDLIKAAVQKFNSDVNFQDTQSEKNFIKEEDLRHSNELANAVELAFSYFQNGLEDMTLFDHCLQSYIVLEFISCKAFRNYLTNSQTIVLVSEPEKENDQRMIDFSIRLQSLTKKASDKDSSGNEMKLLETKVQLAYEQFRIGSHSYSIFKQNLRKSTRGMLYGVETKNINLCLPPEDADANILASVTGFLELAFKDIGAESQKPVAAIYKDKSFFNFDNTKDAIPIFAVYIISGLTTKEKIIVVEGLLKKIGRIFRSIGSKKELDMNYEKYRHQVMLKDHSELEELSSPVWETFNSCFNPENRGSNKVRLILQKSFKYTDPEQPQSGGSSED